jgi:hypothetical protein
MAENLIFWSRPLRLEGRCPVATAEGRLNLMFSGTRFSLSDRPAGEYRDGRLRLWRRGPLAIGGDLVEFVGELRAQNSGSVIEGSLAYKLGTKVQFLGLAAIGAALCAAGIAQRAQGASAEADLLQFGAIVLAVTVAWIYSSSRMKVEQIRFIEERLRGVLAD